ncbi:MAG: methyltransferase [Candidatus Binatia bacterium]
MSNEPESLPDLLQWNCEVSGDEVVYRFANGMQIKTESFTKADPRRILPLGTPQGSLMNHMVHFPETVCDRHVFEPFAGSGALGFMALKLGAASIDFLDINPRASEFHRHNAALNQFATSRVISIQGDIAEFAPARKYGLILANPPFVPTPDGVEGTLTSNGGPEGNRLVEILLTRLDELLEPGGQGLIYVMQFARDGEPLIVDLLERTVRRRPVEITPTQLQHVPFSTFCTAYVRLFGAAESAIERWRAAMVRTHGDGLTLCHYIVDIGPQSQRAAGCVLRDNFAEKFGASFRVPSDNGEELALARVMENFVP